MCNGLVKYLVSCQWVLKYKYLYSTPVKKCYQCIPSFYRALAPRACRHRRLNPRLQSLLLAALSFDHYYLQTVISPWQRCCRCSNKPALRGLWSIMDYSLMAHVLSAQPHQLLLLRIALARIPLQVHYDICASLSSVTACTPIYGIGSWVLFPL